jgi:FAD/FMN-containing dehydrogenase
VWHPVDVSTSAQATLGGMAGNNSCGSRSIAYGNMVHNVTGIEAWLADGSAASFGPLAQASGRARDSARRSAPSPARERDEIAPGGRR